jgi:hypothetical protein
VPVGGWVGCVVGKMFNVRRLVGDAGRCRLTLTGHLPALEEGRKQNTNLKPETSKQPAPK